MILIYTYKEFKEDFYHCYREFSDNFEYEQRLNNPYRYRCESWRSRYSYEVDRMTEYYEKLNAENAKKYTIVRKATPEEIKEYTYILNKVNCHMLTRSKLNIKEEE